MTTMSGFETAVITGRDRSDLLRAADEVTIPAWPMFMRQDPVANRHWTNLYEFFPDYQFALVRTDTGAIIAAANSVPLRFEGSLDGLPEEGWDWALQEAVAQHKRGIQPNLQCALQIVVDSPYRSMKLSPVMIRTMKAIGRNFALEGLLAPVRPNQKHRWPVVTIDDYVGWRRGDGYLFDPWLRAHERLGARLIRPCHLAMRIIGSVGDWRQWTGMDFARSGAYVVPQALAPVAIDLEEDRGLYLEPNVWMFHAPER